MTEEQEVLREEDEGLTFLINLSTMAAKECTEATGPPPLPFMLGVDWGLLLAKHFPEYAAKLERRISEVRTDEGNSQPVFLLADMVKSHPLDD